MRTKNKSITFKIKTEPPIKVWSGSLDANTLKACYYMFGFHTYSTERKNIRSMKNVLNRIKLNVVDNFDRGVFRDNYIFVDSTPHTFDNSTYAYITGEFTFFTKGLYEISYLQEKLQDITPYIVEQLQTHEKFTYSLTRVVR